LSRIQQVIDTLEAERAEVQAHLAWLEQQISTRRATARSRQSDTKASIIEFLAKHPGSTAGDIGKALNLNPGSVSTRLTQLAKTGEIQKASRGYSAT
jgi:DNA-binding MarR family transcriptional regulator